MALQFDQPDALRAKLLEGLTAEHRPGRAARMRTPQDPQARRESIRRTAAEMFASRGLDGASLADIGVALGKAPTFCSHYYRNRDELLYDILHDHVAALDAAMDAVDPLPAWGEPDAQLAVPPLRRLDALAGALLGVLSERSPAQRVLLSALHTLPQAGAETLRFLLRGVLSRVERVLLLAVPRLGRRRALLFPLAASFVAMAAHHVLWFRDDGRLARAEYARLIARLAVAGGKAAYREGVGRGSSARPTRQASPLLPRSGQKRAASRRGTP